MYWQVGVAVRLLICIWDALGSNRGRNTGCPDLASSGFLQTLQTNGKTILALGHNPFLPNFFQHNIHYYYYYSSSFSYYYTTTRADNFVGCGCLTPITRYSHTLTHIHNLPQNSRR
jgi:hypothetical protein